MLVSIMLMSIIGLRRRPLGWRDRLATVRSLAGAASHIKRREKGLNLRLTSRRILISLRSHSPAQIAGAGSRLSNVACFQYIPNALR